MALGANGWALKSLVLRQASLPLFAGIVFGLFGAFVLTRRLESLLYGITPHDPATFAAACSSSPAPGFWRHMRRRAVPPGRSDHHAQGGIATVSRQRPALGILARGGGRHGADPSELR